MTPTFQTKKGWLTRYALACGYAEIEEINLGPGTYDYAGIRMDQFPSTNTLHVYGIGEARKDFMDWYGANLKEARQVYAKARREVKAKWGKPQS